MKKNTICSYIIGYAIGFLLCFLLSNSVSAQCTVVSTNGYTVTVSVIPTGVVTSTTNCPYGYNFNYDINYDITFSGNNIPASLYTLQGNVLASGYSANFYDLPNNGGSGTTISVGNSYTNKTNCNTVTVGYFNPSMQIQIQGPGIPYQSLICPISALPVQVTSFTGSKTEEGILLKWTTAQEKKDTYFTVEKKNASQEWTPLQQIEGAGDSYKSLDYSFTDTKPGSGTNYYRIRQTDINGIYSYTDVIAVDNKQTIMETNVYPNPTIGSTVNVQIITPSGDPVEVYVFNSFGQNLKSYSVEMNSSGSITQQVELPESGNTFFITIMQNNSIIGKHQVHIAN